MFFDNIIRKPNWPELELAYKQLSEMYKDLYQEKQEKIEAQEQELDKLSNKVRHWMRRYHQLNLSVSEDTVEKTDLETQEQDYVNDLQEMVAELSQKNHELEQRLTAQKIATAASARQFSEKSNVVDITQSEQQEKTSKKETTKDLELEFSPKFQALLERHANECKG